MSKIISKKASFSPLLLPFLFFMSWNLFIFSRPVNSYVSSTFFSPSIFALPNTPTLTPIVTLTPKPTSTLTPIPTDTSMEKEILEIEKLREEIRSTKISSWLQTGTLIAAFIATVISFWSAWKSSKSQVDSLKIQAEQHQQNHISGLLGELGSNQVAAKISAIQSLSEYETTAPFLVGLLQIENEQKVINAVITALKRKPQIALPLLISVNKEIYDQHNKWAVELVCLGNDKDKVVEMFGLEKKSFAEMLTSNSSKRINISVEIKVRSLCESEQRDVNEVRESEKKRILTEWSHSLIARDKFLEAFEKIIGHASQLGIACSLEKAILQGIVLDGLDLTKWNFSGANITDASFKDAVCKDANFSSAIAVRSDFRNSSLHDAVFDNSILDDAKFNSARLTRTSLNNCFGKGVKLYGAKLKYVQMVNSQMDQCRFDNCIITNSDFGHSELKGAKFLESVCNDCNFSNATLSGTDFANAKVHRSIFTNAHFAGNNLSRCDFSGSEFNNATLIAIEKVAGIKLFETNWTDAKFEERTDQLVNEIQKQVIK